MIDNGSTLLDGNDGSTYGTFWGISFVTKKCITWGREDSCRPPYVKVVSRFQ